MKADDAAVAGFFEDLPVLMFVLAGVLVLVLSSAWVSRTAAQQRAESGLERAAEEFVERLLVRMRGSGLGYPPPMASSIGGMDLANVSSELAEGLDYSVALLQRYPEARWIKTASSGYLESASATGSCCALFNAMGDSGDVIVMEVRVIVWQT